MSPALPTVWTRWHPTATGRSAGTSSSRPSWWASDGSPRSIYALQGKTMRYTDLKGSIPSISDALLV